MRQTSSFIVLFAAVNLFISCGKNTPYPETPSEAVDKIVQPYIALGGDVGVIVGTVHNNETAIYSFGQKELGSMEKISGQSVLEIASLTKVYTGMALAAMQLSGELSIDDPIEDYLPTTYHIPSYNGHKITLRHLATHTSGFPRYPDNIDEDAYNMYKDYSEENMIAFLNGFELTREPGSEIAYSNIGYGLLGKILALVNNSDYETMITQHVLQPLGMTHTTVSFTPAQLANLVYGYNGTQQVESWAQYQQEIFRGSGSLLSSIEDQLLFLRANIGMPASALDAAVQFAQMPNGDSGAIPFGWNKVTEGDLQLLVKNGGNGGYGSFMGFDKTRKIGVIVLINSSRNPDLFQTDMGMEILKALSK